MFLEASGILQLLREDLSVPWRAPAAWKLPPLSFLDKELFLPPINFIYALFQSKEILNFLPREKETAFNPTYSWVPGEYSRMQFWSSFLVVMEGRGQGHCLFWIDAQLVSPQSCGWLGPVCTLWSNQLRMKLSIIIWGHDIFLSIPSGAIWFVPNSTWHLYGPLQCAVIYLFTCELQRQFLKLYNITTKLWWINWGSTGWNDLPQITGLVKMQSLNTFLVCDSELIS